MEDAIGATEAARRRLDDRRELRRCTYQQLVAILKQVGACHLVEVSGARLRQTDAGSVIRKRDNDRIVATAHERHGGLDPEAATGRLYRVERAQAHRVARECLGVRRYCKAGFWRLLFGDEDTAHTSAIARAVVVEKFHRLFARFLHLFPPVVEHQLLCLSLHWRIVRRHHQLQLVDVGAGNDADHRKVVLIRCIGEMNARTIVHNCAAVVRLSTEGVYTGLARLGRAEQRNADAEQLLQ
jgi:hypothetical protein